MKEKPWDLLMAVEIGVDRLHHGFWKYHDAAHPKHEPGNRFVNSIRDYYVWLDNQIGTLLELVDGDTSVMVFSDHGAQKMDGGIAINEWLINEGYLVLEEKPNGIVPLEKVKVNWAKTRAWGSGGYYGRIFLNVQGREPQGIIPPSEYGTRRREPRADGDIHLLRPQAQSWWARIEGLAIVQHRADGAARDGIACAGRYDWEGDSGDG